MLAWGMVENRMPRPFKLGACRKTNMSLRSVRGTLYHDDARNLGQLRPVHFVASHP